MNTHEKEIRVNGRTIIETRPGICVHGVGTTSDMWCSSCILDGVDAHDL